MAIEDREFCPGDSDKKDKKDKVWKKLQKKLKKALKESHDGKKKRKKLEKKLEKAVLKLSTYESMVEERELRHQVELQNARLEATIQMIVKANGKVALPEVVQYDE